MRDIRPVFMVIGLLLVILAVAMVFPTAVDLIRGNPDWTVFAASSGVTLFIGAAMVLTSRAGRFKLNLRQAFVLTTFSWLALTAFAALPFTFAEMGLSYTDAFFEAMSGITTTGSTVIVGLDNAPPGILLWRAILQWLGGVGIIIMALTVLPMLQVGGMQMFKVEAFEAQEKVLPRAASLASALAMIYIGLTALWAFANYFAGMTGFQAVAHSMTTIATGGFSTSDGSIGHFNSPLIDVLTTTGMIVGSIPFLLYFQAVRGNVKPLTEDSQVRWFLTIAGTTVLTVALWLWLQGRPFWDALNKASFNVVSVMTGTGYATENYWAWGAYPVAAIFLIQFVGGCAGSTTCGIKVFRFQILYSAAKVQMARLLQPSGVFIPYYNKRPLQDGVTESVMGFFFLYVVSFAFLAMALGFTGLDFVTAISGAATAISNVGPGMGDIIGPAGNFSSLPDSAKWLLSAGMLLGRLELFSVLVLLMPQFWKN